VNKVANPAIVAGITASLMEHFGHVEFTTGADGKTHSVIFRATCRPCQGARLLYHVPLQSKPDTLPVILRNLSCPQCGHGTS
jgi:hypothetical protein